jgi:tetratricopeptide (TPR) repeat protein
MELVEILADLNRILSSNPSRLKSAMIWYQMLLNYQRETLGSENTKTIKTMVALADVYSIAGHRNHWSQAVQLLEECLKFYKKTLDDDHSDTMEMKLKLGVAYSTIEDFSQAIPLLKECMLWSYATHGKKHPKSMNIMAQYAAFCFLTGKESECATEWKECWDGYKASLGRDAFQTLSTNFDTAFDLYRKGMHSEALKSLEVCLGIVAPTGSPNMSDPITQICIFAFCQIQIKSLEKMK